MENKSLKKHANKPRERYDYNNEDIVYELENLEEIALKNEFELSHVIAMAHVIEMRRLNAILIEHGDRHDTQICDIATHLEDVTLAIQKGI